MPFFLLWRLGSLWAAIVDGFCHEHISLAMERLDMPLEPSAVQHIGDPKWPFDGPTDVFVLDLARLVRQGLQARPACIP